MKYFESFLAPDLEAYIRHRAAFGYKYRHLRSILRHVDRYAKSNFADWTSLTPTFFLEFKESLHAQASTVNTVLSGVRGFFQFLVDKGCCKYNPLQDIPSLSVRLYIPFIFSQGEIDQLLSWIVKRNKDTYDSNLRNSGAYIAILLMARCGLRISEPLKLLLTHYRAKDGSIYISKSKFQSSRLVPVPRSVQSEIQNYLSFRDSLPGEDKNTYLLAGQGLRSLGCHHVYLVFRQAVKDMGICEARCIAGNMTFGAPTPHSLRHSFAVNTLHVIKQKGKSTRKALPLLAAYMGHHHPSSTARYLCVSDAEHRKKLQEVAMAFQWEV